MIDARAGRSDATRMLAGTRVVLRATALLAVALATSGWASGCGGGDDEPMDSGAPLDAAHTDVIEIGRDSAPVDAAEDGAAATDAATASCATGACDPSTGAGCGAPGACVLADRIPECVDAVGEGTVGAACASERECAPGLACFRDGSTGVCARVCCPGDPSACDVGMRCSADGVLVTGVATTWGRCAAPRACDPRTPECPAREGCYIRYPEPGAECRLAGTAGAGESCAVPEDCQPGFHCAGIGSPACVRVCTLADPRSCPDAEGTCVAQAYSPEGTGVCVMTARAW